MNLDGYTQEEIFTCPYDISDDTKKELLVEEVSPMICCFAGIFSDCYHLIERGVMPQMPFAMKSIYGKIPENIEGRVIDIYKSSLYAITQTNYLGDNTPVAYLNVIKCLMAIGTENTKSAGRQLLLESMAVWENCVLNDVSNQKSMIPSSVEEGIKRMEDHKTEYRAKSGSNGQIYLSGLQSLLLEWGQLEEAGRIKVLGITASRKSSSREPSNKLVEMVKVEGGTFKMGSTNNDIHQVTLDAFYIGKFPVTQREWEVVMGSNPSGFKGTDRPVERVSWYEAVDFCNALSKREGFEECYKIDGANVVLDVHAIGYRLPTEAEWEYAARGGNKSRGYTFAGSNSLGEVGWYEDNSGKTTHSVQQKGSNELGLYDMSGNVWEWCWDLYDGNYYAGSPNKNPTGPASGSCRVYRGGSWNFSLGYCMVSYRLFTSPGASGRGLGFRLALACSSK